MILSQSHQVYETKIRFANQLHSGLTPFTSRRYADLYSSSFVRTPGSPTSSHAAGVPISIRYTHFSDSDTRHSSSFSAHASHTSVRRFGPFQQPWPFSNFM